MKVPLLLITLSFLCLESFAQNNSGVSLSFDVPASTGTYTVSELAGNLRVCVIADGVINNAFDASLTFLGFSATVGVDFIVESPIVVLSYSPFGSTTQCTDIEIVEDDVLEFAIEPFLITATASDPQTSESVIANIEESIVIEIILVDESYTAQEGSPVQLCTTIVGTITIVSMRTVIYTLTPTQRTADEFDYSGPSNGGFTEATANDQNCIMFPILEDSFIEGTEVFNITVTSTDLVKEGSSAIIYIEDNDGATVALSSTQLSISEGSLGSLSESSVCVHLTNVQDGLKRDVVVLLDTIADTADESDYVPLTSQLITIPAESAVSQDFCAIFSVHGDNIREDNETLTISVQVQDTTDSFEGSTTVTITILDDGDVLEDCGSLDDPQNGVVDFPDTIQGSVATYTCSVGYEVSGLPSNTRNCQSSGEWSGTDPTCELVDCGAPPSASPSGEVTVTTTTYLSTANYSCLLGYTQDEAEAQTLVCQVDMTWSGVAPSCEIVDCGTLTDPPNGEVTLDTDTTTFGSTASYVCENGYFVDEGSSASRQCEATAEWEPEEPVCSPVSCPMLSNPENGVVDVTDRTLGNTATYTCDTGHVLEGESSRTCMPNAMWSDDEPVCIAQCGILAAPINGSVEQTGTVEGSTTTYQCVAGYILNLEIGDEVRTCTEEGVWSGDMPECDPRDCGSLDAPDGGVINIGDTTFGSVASYSCNEGYTFDGDESRMCNVDGEWTGSQPTCTIVECTENLFNPVDGGVDIPLSRVFGSIANYSCLDGFILMGVARRTCQADMTWSGVTPTCHPVDCGELMDPVNGTVMVTMTTLDGVAIYSCDDGFDLEGLGGMITRGCLASGMWSDSDPTCEPVDCGPLSNPTNGVVIQPETVFPALAVYECQEGHEITSGSETRKCQSNMEWSGSEATCEAISCGELPDPDNGQVDMDNDIFDSSATYSCILGYEILGVAIRTCLANMSWSDEQPTCERVNCGTLDSPPNGNVNLDEGILFGDEARYECNEGYNMMSGDSVRTCTADAVWSGEEPRCEIVDCGSDYGTPGSGTADDSEGTTFGSIVRFSCLNGFLLIGASSRECLATGEWSRSPPICQEISCPQLPDPENGDVEIMIIPGLSAVTSTYTCNIGFDLVGDSLRGCDPLGEENAGEWTGVAPTCLIVDCGTPSSLTTGSVNFTDTTFNSIATYECNEGYGLQPPDDSSRRRRCQDDATWFGIDPICQIVVCQDLPDPVNGQVQFTSTVFGSEASYSCNVGFQLSSEDNRTCAGDSEWTGEEPLCEDVDECLRNICSDACANLVGGFMCSCSQGYQLADDLITCEDINECSLEGDGFCDQGCNNTVGSFSCSCSEGFELNSDGLSCNDIDECSLEMDDCHDNADCVNTDGSFMCMCQTGFLGDGRVECQEPCSIVAQLVLNGVDCDTWRFDNTQEKIEDIDSFVHSAISPTCDCSFPRGNVLGGGFTCPTDPNMVVYRSELRGSDTTNCENLISSLQRSIESQANPSVFVDGNLLELSANCEFSVSSINSEVMCLMTVTSEPLAGSDTGTAAIAGGVAGVVAVVLLLLIVVVCVVLIMRRRNVKRSKFANSEVTTNANTSYGRSLPLLPYESQPTEHIYTTATPNTQTTPTQTSTFSASANVIPRVGTLERNKNRYIDVKIDPQTEMAVPVSIPQPGHKEEGIYEKVYDDGMCIEVEEIYDVSVDRDLGPDCTEMGDEKESRKESISECSEESENTGTSKITDDFPLGSFAGIGGIGGGGDQQKSVRNSSEAANPLYDQLNRQMVV